MCDVPSKTFNSMEQQLSSVAMGLQCWVRECCAQEHNVDLLAYSPHFALLRSDPKITLREAYRPPLVGFVSWARQIDHRRFANFL